MVSKYLGFIHALRSKFNKWKKKVKKRQKKGKSSIDVTSETDLKILTFWFKLFIKQWTAFDADLFHCRPQIWRLFHAVRRSGEVKYTKSRSCSCANRSSTKTSGKVLPSAIKYIIYVADAINTRIRGLNISGVSEHVWSQVYETQNKQDVYVKTTTAEAAAE